MNHLAKFEKRWADRELTPQMMASLDAWDMVNRRLRVLPRLDRHVAIFTEMMNVPADQRDEFFWNEYRLAFRRYDNARQEHELRTGTMFCATHPTPRKPPPGFKACKPYRKPINLKFPYDFTLGETT